MAKKQSRNNEKMTLETARNQAGDLRDNSEKIEAIAWALEMIEYLYWPSRDERTKGWIRSILLNDLTETTKRLKKQTRDHLELLRALGEREVLAAAPKAA
jgi:hypothetical protein